MGVGAHSDTYLHKKIKIKGQIHSWIYPDEHDVWPASRKGDQIKNQKEDLA